MRISLASLFTALGLTTAAATDTLELYIDADYSVSFAAAEAIELGVRTALNEVDHQLGGMPVELVPKDHRGNAKRSHRTMEEYLDSDRALAMIGGLHSPPYLTYREFINDSGILTLLPWSASAPITRTQGDENWFFRVSVDDSKSGEFFVREAMDRQGCTSLALILLDTGWGRAGEVSLTAALAARNMRPVVVEYFPFSVGRAVAGTLASNVASSGADCAVIMANAVNGATVFRALFEQAPSLRIFSDWGIMGGNFTDEIDREMRQRLDIQVLQTCALRIEAESSGVLTRALQTAKPEATSLADIGAVTGFVHGYDITRILIAAADQAARTDAWPGGTIQQRRAALKAALENLQTPVDGILKTYDPPFRPWASSDADAREALGLDDLCMARFREDGLLKDAG
ncbi:MAG: ABC transporter substrate-binding protein [Pseudomonadota bacterium]